MPKFDADKWLAISAIVVSIGTLAALAYQSMLMRDSERASKLPYLYISLMANDQIIAVQLANSGIGPAIVDDVQIHYQGKDVPADPFDFYMGLSDDNRRNGAGVDKIQKGRLIPAGVTIQMLTFTPGPTAVQSRLLSMLRLFEIAEVPRAWYDSVKVTDHKALAVIDIIYKSVYGERWRVRSDRIVPEEL